MEWLITAGIVSLVFGLVSLLSREVLCGLGEALNKPVAYIDDKLKVIRIPVGIVLTIIGVWIISVAFNYPVLWYLHIIGIIILLFGLFYLFVPQWLDWLSKVLDQALLSADEMVIGARKTLGVVFVVAAVYIFYTVYLLIK